MTRRDPPAAIAGVTSIPTALGVGPVANGMCVSCHIWRNGAVDASLQETVRIAALIFEGGHAMQSVAQSALKPRATRTENS